MTETTGRWAEPALRPDRPDDVEASALAPQPYPAEYERDAVLADGRTVHMRPVLPTDVDCLAEALERADAETIRRRFLGGGPPRTPAALRRLVTVDFVRRFALAASARFRASSAVGGPPSARRPP